MKHFIFTLFCIVSIATYAQNGGQAAENTALKIEYVGVVSGHYTAKITSKQGCKAWYKCSFNGAISDVQINSYAVYMFDLGTQPPGGFTFKVKATTDCRCGDMGWVELKLSTLPLTFKSVVFTRNSTNPNKGVLTFETADVVNVNRFILRAKLDDGTIIGIGILMPLQSHTIYQYPVDDIKAVAKRLQTQ